MAEPVDLTALREEYAADGLREDDLAPDPVTMFERWFADARLAGLYDVNAMVLSTVSAAGRPSARAVLLKGLDSRGFIFFTNTASQKGEELAANPVCALHFPWFVLERQVRVDGVAEPLPRDEVAAYFDSRPRGSQLGAWASPQSSVVTGRDELDAAYAEVSERFPDQVPVPDDWGGYAVRPDRVEFWQGRPGRMHDRLVYIREPSSVVEPVETWRIERLAP
ncbi:pyridoxamine 5'-phosphate oxidase [Nocardioides speluncae]|uniref:pyridoxamine 5'-phosphate oxidase n=1 Tax=Nocardioides speluncae TaxID=2670337 RepID=UPI000D69E26A|nr:pyridoxamine 5'-phosphate oxidase [Nocardioides speluncae]